MGSIKIVSRTVPEIGAIAYQKNDFGREGRYPYERVLVCDNFFAQDVTDHWRLYVLPEAAEQIFSHIHWGEYHPDNLVEQGGFLLGRYLRDEARQTTVCLVDRAVPAVNAAGTAGYLVMQESDMAAAHLEMARLNSTRTGADKLRMVGWFHTHPNNLDVFMSGTDRGTQSSLFAGEDAVSIVLNPNRKIWKCFRSQRCLPVKGELLLDSPLVRRMGVSTIHNQHYRKE